MKKTILTIVLAFFSLAIFAQVNTNYHYVSGYYKSNGTYVQPHYQTNPNSTINDNYSTYPNVNPWTGTQGTISPTYSYPTYTPSTYMYCSPSYIMTPSTNYYYSTPSYTYPSYSTSTYYFTPK